MPVVAIDLFCGIGGLTHGLQLAGLPVVAGIDIEKTCKFAYEENNKAKFILEDITKISSNELKKYYPKNSIKVLVGCAPCQPFSHYTLRYNKNGKKDNKWRLIYYFSNLVSDILPDIISMENVPKLIKEKVFFDFITKLQELGYYYTWQIVDCASYGVPQSRKRLVLLASKLGEIKLIPPKYDKEHYLTVRDAIGQLPHLEDGEIDTIDALHCSSKLSPKNKLRIKQSIPGGTWKDWDDDLKLVCHKKNSGESYGSVYGRMEWDKPSPTITTQYYGYGNGRFGHPEQDRALSMREGALLQSFPPYYKFIDPKQRINKRTLGMHIGNAVPVELGKAIGISILQHIKRLGKINDKS